MSVQPQRNSSAGRVKLGELLVKAGVITGSQLRTALQEQKQWGGKLGDILVRMRYLSEDVFVRALSKQLGLPRADLSGSAVISSEALSRVPGDLCAEYEVLPYALLEDGKTLAVATSDPLNLTVLDAVSAVARCRVVATVAGASQIRAAIARLYLGEETPAVDPRQMRVLDNSENIQGPGGDVSPRGVSVPPPMPGLFPPVAAPPARPGTDTNPYLRAVFQPAAVAGPAHPPTPLPGMLPVQGGPTPAPVVDDGHRREAAAIKALVELLVQKGIISLDEYLARLKR